MKYEGFKIVETELTENKNIINAPRPRTPQTDTGETHTALPSAPPASTTAPAASKLAKPARRSVIKTLFKQTVIVCAALIALLFCKYADGGFASDVFKSVKDIVGYNYEVADGVYDKDAATFVDIVYGFFKKAA